MIYGQLCVSQQRQRQRRRRRPPLRTQQPLAATMEPKSRPARLDWAGLADKEQWKHLILCFADSPTFRPTAAAAAAAAAAFGAQSARKARSNERGANESPTDSASRAEANVAAPLEWPTNLAAQTAVGRIRALGVYFIAPLFPLLFTGTRLLPAHAANT